jgi:O-antigen/teichoic acid export membrane protein
VGATNQEPQFQDALRQGSLAFRVKSLVRDSATYGSVDVISQMLGILLVPIIVRVFAASEYAIVDGIRVASVLVLGIALMGLNQAAARFISQEDDERTKGEIVGAALLAALAITAALCAVLFIAAPQAMGFFLQTGEGPYVRAFRFMLVAAPFTVAITFAKMLLKWNFRRRAFAALSVGHTGAVLVLSVLFVVPWRRGVPGIFEAQLLGTALAAAAAAVLCRRHVAWPRGRGVLRPRLKPLFGFGSPLMLVGTLQNLIPSLERFLIVRFLGLGPLGLYAVGQRFAAIVGLPVGGFNVAWTPFAYTLYREKDAQPTFRRVLTLYCAAAGVLALGFILVADRVLPLFASNRYAGALEVVVPLVYAVIIGSLSSFSGLGIALANRTYLSAIAYGVHLAVTATGILLLVGPHGLAGVAYGVLFGKLALVAFETYASWRAYPLRLRWTVPLGLLLVSFGLALAVARFWWRAP